ncbi:MAG: hypothetical protein GYB66_02790 [Chloroflexi bacterium]|nr:hypothetical protein [Chloroflexota bacterium]
MAIFLDSARPQQAARAQELGFVSGIITNPHRMREVGRPGLEILEDLVKIFDGHVLYQPTGQTLEARIDEAWQAYDLRPDRVVIKLPASTENLGFLKHVPEIEVAITTIYSPLQAYAAAEAGAQFVIPYVSHIEAELGDSASLVQQIAKILQGYPTELLATDISDLSQVLACLETGADHVALPLELILALGNHELTEKTVAQHTVKENHNEQS